ncbi:MAG TPA: hypothetical protein VN674_05185 [Gemmatimonadales bacterium]|nr:hypothetical protein [Gemmatimonadales bacterium]
MRKMLVAVALLGGAVAPLTAQGGGGMGGGRGFAPPPNHWMTMDSVGSALGLTAAEMTAIQPQYDSINGILKRSAAMRDSIRASMQGGGDPRAAMAAARPMMQSLQDQEDALIKEIHGKISAAAAAKLDAAPPPRVMRQRPAGGMGGGPGR